MKPDTRTVTELFESAVRYVVPLYQRPYVWNQKDQWDPLWEDISVLLDHQLNGMPMGPNGHWSHFLGAIVLDQETQAPGSIPVYTVIDGQQRLTTLQILLCAAANVAMENAAENDSQILLGLIRNNPFKATGDNVWKVWPTNANRDAFMTVVREGGPAADRVDDTRNLIDEAYDYFLRTIRDWLTAAEGQDPLELLHTLTVTLCDLLRVVSITLEPGDNAQVIFETLNARGTPLLALDLVKNALFHEATRQKQDVDRLYEQVWKPQLDAEYWRREQRQGRLNRPRADLFLMHWLTMKLRRVTPATELFTTFRKQILQTSPAPDTGELTRELCRDAGVMRGFEFFPPGSDEALFFERLEALDSTTALPLVLYLFREPKITAERRMRALKVLESWLVRRTLLRLTAKNYNLQTPVLIARMAEDPPRADEILLGELRPATSEISRWPADRELHDYFATHNAYDNIARSRLVMALKGVELSLYSSKTDVVTIPTSLSIEHILPQSWEDSWPLPDGLTPEEEEAARTARLQSVHRLGNLTLTAQPLNTALSNGPWAEKQKALNAESKLLLNARLIEAYPDSFDEKVIDERTRFLVERICQVWPGPEHHWIPGETVPPLPVPGTPSGTTPERPPAPSFYVDFWTAFWDEMTARNVPFSIRKAADKGYAEAALGKTGYSLGSSITPRTGEASVYVWIGTPKVMDEFTQFRQKYQALVEEQLGSLVWTPPVGRASATIEIKRKFDDVSNRATWPDIINWLGTTMVNWYRVLRPLVTPVGVPTPPGQPSVAQQTQLEFWTAFGEFLKETGSAFTCGKPQPQNWMTYALGRTGVYLSSVASWWDSEANTWTGELRVELVLDGAKSKQRFALLAGERDAIEAEIGHPLVWYNPEDRQVCRIYVRQPADIGNRGAWPEQHAWLRQRLEQFHSVFAQRVQQLDVGGPDGTEAGG